MKRCKTFGKVPKRFEVCLDGYLSVSLSMMQCFVREEEKGRHYECNLQYCALYVIHYLSALFNSNSQEKSNSTTFLPKQNGKQRLPRKAYRERSGSVV